jgi:nitric oxide reductase NorD protein
MEEWIGERWHRFITRAADRSHAQAAVTLEQVQRSAALLFRAAGGSPGVRLVPAGVSRLGGPRDWLQRLAGAGQRGERAQLDADTLALPPRIAVHADTALNRDLYLWLAALAAVYEPREGWLADNLRAGALALQRCPGLQPRWQRLRDAELALRPPLSKLRGAAADAEAAVQAALRGGYLAAPAVDSADAAPVWMWLEALPAEASSSAGASANKPSGTQAQSGGRTRRRTRRVDEQPQDKRPALLLASKLESLLTWSEHVSADRAEDDEPDENAQLAADDMERLSLARGKQQTSAASRIKFDLDLPSAAQDDVPLGAPLALPEWDWKRRRLLPAHCAVQLMESRPGGAFVPAAALRRSAAQMRRRLEVLRAAPQWQRACAEGEALDLDAWVRHSAALRRCEGPEPAVFARRTRGERSLATLLLADLSLSTDAHCSNEQRVIDVIREALYVFGEALDGCGDAFEMLGSSSVRRSHVRVQQLKRFDEGWGREAQARVGAIKPGYYTRMGAAIRAATARLVQRPERQRLLLILTDGKPNDLDVYEGRWGIEDTRHAVLQAREAGLLPFCLSIDAEAHDYLPHLFGSGGWAQVREPTRLPQRLTGVYAQLAR